MKRVLLLCLVLAVFFQAKSQNNIIIGEFESGIPADWTLAGGTQLRQYPNPVNNCITENGLQTPGVGGNNPGGFITPAAAYNSANPIVSVSFNIYVFESDMKCSSSTNFPCSTYVNVYLVPATYNNAGAVPTGSDILASRLFQIVQANGSNTIVFNDLTIPAGTSYRVYFNFTADNCNQGGLKYILDGIRTTETTCSANCAPFANNDHFEFGVGGFITNTLNANVYGGFASWASDPLAAGYGLKSLESGTAINNGLDGDLNIHPLAQMKFELVTGLNGDNVQGCLNENPNLGILTFNENGTFTYVKGDVCVNQVSFTYKIKDPTSLYSGTAKVTIVLSENSPQPVTFSNFHAQRARDKVALKWETLSEQNNRGFNVQRNTRGVWETVAFVFSQADGGNSDELLTYEYKDANSEKGVSQYRIQQVDLDGKASYSAIRSIKGLEQAGTRTVVYPNPSQDGKVSVVFEDQGAKAVVVSDMSGRVVRQYRNVLNNVQIEGLESGMYSIQITELSSGVSSTEKVIIKKR